MEGPAESFEQGDEEVVSGAVVIAEARVVESVREGPPQFVQVAAVAATGFVAGAATAAVLSRRFARTAARRELPPLRRDSPEIVSTRRYVVDVHTIAQR